MWISQDQSELHKLFRRSNSLVCIFHVLQESHLSMGLIMTFLWGKIAKWWQHNTENTASVKMGIGGPTPTARNLSIISPPKKFFCWTYWERLLAVINNCPLQEFWRQMLNLVSKSLHSLFLQRWPFNSIKRKVWGFFHLCNSNRKEMILAAV